MVEMPGRAGDDGVIEMPGQAGHDVYKSGMTLWLRCPVEPGMTGMTGSVVLDVDVEFRVWELDVVLW